jgi:hypothetical protein
MLEIAVRLVEFDFDGDFLGFNQQLIRQQSSGNLQASFDNDLKSSVLAVTRFQTFKRFQNLPNLFHQPPRRLP